MLARSANAQQVAGWPLTSTGKVAFTGVLPWPASVITSSQRQALARQWFRTKLTDADKQALLQEQDSDSTYAHLPTYAYLDSVESPRTIEVQCFRLLYAVHLTPTANGLSYQLSEFEYVCMGYDNSTGIALETALRDYPAERAKLAVCRKRLGMALTSW